MQIPRQRRAKVALELSPLIDCVFLLLIFFMLSSSFLTPSIELTLPSAQTEAPPSKQPIFISLDASGAVFLNKNEVSFDGLGPALSLLLTDSEEKSVTIRGDEKMDYEYFVKALDIAKESGAVHVNVAHQGTD